LRLLIAVVVGALIADAWFSYRNINVLLSQERAISALHPLEHAGAHALRDHRRGDGASAATCSRATRRI
jgi:hypothetical protein